MSGHTRQRVSFAFGVVANAFSVFPAQSNRVAVPLTKQKCFADGSRAGCNVHCMSFPTSFKTFFHTHDERDHGKICYKANERTQSVPAAKTGLNANTDINQCKANLHTHISIHWCTEAASGLQPCNPNKESGSPAGEFKPVPQNNSGDTHAHTHPLQYITHNNMH